MFSQAPPKGSTHPTCDFLAPRAGQVRRGAWKWTELTVLLHLHGVHAGTLPGAGQHGGAAAPAVRDIGRPWTHAHALTPGVSQRLSLSLKPRRVDSDARALPVPADVLPSVAMPHVPITAAPIHGHERSIERAEGNWHACIWFVRSQAERLFRGR